MQPNDVIAGRYRLLRPIGAGATGTVWAAKHELVGREYALKIAPLGERAARDARELFLREVRIVGALRHRNVVDIADAGEADDALYLAMELLDGEVLAERIARGPLPPAEALGIMEDIARGLAAAHAAGVIHRDIKPENVFLTRGADGEEVTKLLDFGVSSARGTGSGRLYGTPAYMSPEQALGEPDVDHRVDVWAAGVVLYEMLMGRRPFDAESYPALLPIIIDRPYPPLPGSIPAEVSAVVARCLAKERAARYESAEALLAALERAREQLGAPRSTGGLGRAPARSASAPRRRVALVASIAAAALGLVAVAVVASTRRSDTNSIGTAAPTAVVSAIASAPEPAPLPPPPSAATSTAAAPSATAVASATAAPSASAGAGVTNKARAPAPGKSRVTKVNSAGF